jgi:hypothetical protein
VIFSPVTLTQPAKTITRSSTTTVIPGIIWTYSPGPYPTYTPSNPTSTWVPPGPPPGSNGGSHGSGYVKPKPGKPGPTCHFPEICGIPCIFGCTPKLPCIGICGCIGPGCPPNAGTCVGFGCNGGNGDGDDGNNESCTNSAIVTDCEVGCSVTLPPNAKEYTTTCYTTSCGVYTVGCGEKGTTVTTETTVGCTDVVLYTAWYDGQSDWAMPTLGAGGQGGNMDETGTWTPDATVTPPATSSGATPIGPPPPNTSVDWNNPACIDCTDNLGASDCKPADEICLLAQCFNDLSCTVCNFDCNQLFAKRR